MLNQDQLEDVINEVVDRIVNQFEKDNGSATAGLVLNERVITTAQIPQGLSHGDEVIIRPKAVVTPAAIDLFKDRGVGVKRMPVAATTPAVMKDKRQFVVVGGGLPESLKATRLLAEFPEIVQFDCVIEAGRNITEFSRTIVLTDSPEIAVVAMSRLPSLRTVELNIEQGMGAMERRCTSVAANVLVVGREDVGNWRLPAITKKFFELQYAAIPAWL
tara:strand:- start:6045 stop:6695 length:651 start_codon:yes stop_codon:yes gene_type:complete